MRVPSLRSGRAVVLAHRAATRLAPTGFHPSRLRAALAFFATRPFVVAPWPDARGGGRPPLTLSGDQGTTSPLDPCPPPALFGRPGEDRRAPRRLRSSRRKPRRGTRATAWPWAMQAGAPRRAKPLSWHLACFLPTAKRPHHIILRAFGAGGGDRPCLK